MLLDRSDNFDQHLGARWQCIAATIPASRFDNRLDCESDAALIPANRA
jgi:hypothetical protein